MKGFVSRQTVLYTVCQWGSENSASNKLIINYRGQIITIKICSDEMLTLETSALQYFYDDDLTLNNILDTKL